MEFIDGVVLIREICGFSIISLIALFVCTSCLVSIYLLLKEGQDEISKRFCSILKIAIVAFICLTSYEIVEDPFNLKKPTGKYKVIITRDVDMTEFQDTYEVVDYENSVYTIKAKGNEN